jgi:glycyl-tRNA synthetase
MSSHPEANLNPSDLDAAGLDKAIHSQGDHIRHLKTQGATKEQLKLEVERLNLLKEEKVKRDAEKGEEGAEKVPEKEKFDRGALESVLTKRFFYAPAFGIYGGE